MWVKKDINVKIGISQYVALNTFLLLVRIHKFSSGLSPKRAYFRECLFLGFFSLGRFISAPLIFVPCARLYALVNSYYWLMKDIMQ